MSRNIVTLIAVAVASALLLTGLNGATQPTIEENLAEMHQEVLEEFFPEMDYYEEEEYNDTHYDIVYNAEGEKLGVMTEVVASGYGGDIIYYLAISEEGEIKGVSIVDHEETPGIGDIIEEEDFQANFAGKTYEDSISEDVVAVTGATVSSNAFINSVDEAIQKFASHILGIEDVVVDVSRVPDGVYEGTGFGYSGEPIEVEVEVAGGEIVGVDIITFGDAERARELTEEEVPRRMVENQAIYVDAVSRATESSKGIMEAVENALQQALDEQ